MSNIFLYRGEGKMNLVDLRKKFNLSQEDLAKLLGVTQAKVSRLESHELELKVSELGKLIKALDLNAEYYESLIDDAISNAKPPRNSNKRGMKNDL